MDAPTLKTSLKKKKTRFFETYITKLLKQVSDTNGITSNAKQQLNSCLCLIAKLISSKVIYLTEIAKKKTISEKEVKNALRIVLSGELSKNAIIQGQKAIDKFSTDANDSSSKGNSRQDKAGILFPPSILEKFLRNFSYSKIMVTSSAPVYLAAAIEYLTLEIIENASSYAKDNKRVRVTIRDLEIGVRNDKELNDFFTKHNISFLGGGVVPFIHSSLLSKKNRKKRVKKENDNESDDKKKHRFRPGTVSIREIRRYQKMSNCLTFAKFPFEKLVREVVAKQNAALNNQDSQVSSTKISKDVFVILQYFIEQYIVSTVRDANFAAIHAGRVKLMPIDIEFVQAISNKCVQQLYQNNSTNETFEVEGCEDEGGDEGEVNDGDDGEEDDDDDEDEDGEDEEDEEDGEDE
jgi:histone H3/H4